MRLKCDVIKWSSSLSKRKLRSNFIILHKHGATRENTTCWWTLWSCKGGQSKNNGWKAKLNKNPLEMFFRVRVTGTIYRGRQWILHLWWRLHLWVLVAFVKDTRSWAQTRVSVSECKSLKINRMLTGHETVPLGLKHSKGNILSLIKHVAAVPAAMSSVSCCGKCVIKMQWQDYGCEAARVWLCGGVKNNGWDFQEAHLDHVAEYQAMFRGLSWGEGSPQIALGNQKKWRRLTYSNGVGEQHWKFSSARTEGQG